MGAGLGELHKQQEGRQQPLTKRAGDGRRERGTWGRRGKEVEGGRRGGSTAQREQGSLFLGTAG